MPAYQKGQRRLHLGWLIVIALIVSISGGLLHVAIAQNRSSVAVMSGDDDDWINK